MNASSSSSPVPVPCPADAGRRGAGDRALGDDQHDARTDQPRPVPPDIGWLKLFAKARPTRSSRPPRSPPTAPPAGTPTPGRPSSWPPRERSRSTTAMTGVHAPNIRYARAISRQASKQYRRRTAARRAFSLAFSVSITHCDVVPSAEPDADRQSCVVWPD